jgi:hypothetical protein
MLSRYITKLVISILEKNEIARDDVMIVIKTIHDFEMAVLKKNKEDYYDMVFYGTLSKVETIARVWRKVQEDKPELRGKEWELRQMRAGQISLDLALNNQLKLF